MFDFVLVALLIAQSSAAASQSPSPPGELKVVLAAPIYQPDGGVTAVTTTLSAGEPNVVHVYGKRSVCETATSGAAEPTDAGFGWRVASKTVSLTDSLVQVSVDWRRVWDRGRKLTNGPSGTVQLKLHPGARIPLDHIPNPAASDACRAVGLGLEVRLARTAPTPPVDSALVPLGSTAGGASPIDADIWLVQRLPSGAEQTHHQKMRLDTRGGSFSFAPVKVSGDRGEVDVEILGSFQRYRSPVGEYLYVTVTRAITGESMPPAGARAGNGTMIPLPGPEQVLALEIPGPGSPRGGGGRGSIGVARGRGGAAAGTPPPNPTAPPVSAARGGGGGGRGGAALSAQVSEILQGHAFSLRLKFTPVPGS